MKKVKKRYGVYGMMEYQALIKVGKCLLHVPFTEGSATALGTTPATYTTDNLMFQHAIEHSKDFLNGNIELLQTMEMDEDVYIASEHEAHADNGENATDAPDEGENLGDVDNTEDNTDTDADGDTDTDGDGEDVPTVKCASNSDAKQYLEDNFNVKTSLRQTRADLVELGRQYGVNFVFE